MPAVKLDTAIRPIAPMNRSAPLQFLDELMRERFAHHGTWPTIRLLLQTAGDASRAGKWAPPGQSKQWKHDPEAYFRGYLTWALDPKHPCVEYVE